VVKRAGKSTFIGIDSAISLEWTATNDESTRCHFCPNNCARTFIDAARPRGQRPLHQRLLLREGDGRVGGGHAGLTADRKKLMKKFPNLVDSESKLLFRHFYDPQPVPADGGQEAGRRGPQDHLGVRRIQVERTFERSAPEAGSARGGCASASPRC
jgi:hypothetical protein